MLLLSVLKYAGIVLLYLTGIVLFLAVLVLFVPIRYRFRGNSEGKTVNGSVSATWLLHLLKAEITCRSGNITDREVKVFGIRLKEKELREPGENVIKRTETEKSISEPGNSDQNAIIGQKDSVKDRIPEVPSVEMSMNSGEDIFEIGSEKGSGILPDGPGIKKKEGFTERTHRISVLIRQKISVFRETFAGLCEKKERLESLWWKKENLPLLEKTKKAVLRILNEILPVKGTLTVEFGLGDPWKTGRILETAAWLFPVFENRIVLIPFFDEKKLLTEADITGRIRLSVLLSGFLKVWTDRRIRNLVSDTKEILNTKSTI